VSEVQGEGNVIVYTDVFLRHRDKEMLLCKIMCPRYKVRKIFLCTVMYVSGTEWEKCYCKQ